jgi:AraC-like DNA-binding protein
MAAGELLTHLDLRNPRRRRVSLSAPWGARIPSGGGSPGVYLVASGAAWIALPDRPAIALEQGDVAVLPQGLPHSIASRPDAKICPVEALCDAFDEHVEAGSGGAATELRTLCFDAHGSTQRAIMSFAPNILVLRAQEARPWFSHVARAACDLIEEVERAPELAECRLGELLIVEALAGNVLGANREIDAPVLRAALLLRSDLAASWTVRTLALRVGVSRSAFHDRFVRALGSTPSAYLLRARMEEAAMLLQDGLSIAEIAGRVGYRWASSFAVAFRRFHGTAPSSMRKPSQAAQNCSTSDTVSGGNSSIG